MTPSARLSAAIDVLDQWRAGMPAEQALTRWARNARYAGSKDRAAVRDHVFDVLRQLGSCERAGGGDTGRALVLGLCHLTGADIPSLFNGAGHAPAPLAASELAAMAKTPTPQPRRDVPDWTLPLLEARGAEQTDTLLSHFGHRAPLWLRVNLRRASRDAVAAQLRNEGIDTEPGAAATALQVTHNPRKLRQSEAFLSGLVEPQDLSVQIAMAHVDWPSAGNILDYCAGGGGKSLALADMTDARVLAHDANPRRMADVPVRAARAGVSIPTMTTPDLSGMGACTAVLVDAPCSGSGTWRRDPEAKWRLTPERLVDLVGIQRRILDEAAQFVTESGQLVYMTCSLFAAENEDQMAAFLDRHRGWCIESTRQDTSLTASDGFFSAVLRRG